MWHRVHRILPFVFLATSLAAATSTPAYAVNDCNDADYVRSFNPSLAGRRCHEVTRVPIRWSGGTAWFRILALDDVHAGFQVNQTVAWIRQVAAGLGRAMDQMGGLQLDDPTIMITNLPEPEVGGIPAWAYVLPVQPYPGQCLGIVFSFDRTYVPEVSQLVLAHEMFHCIQQKTWPGSLAATGRNWWVEGSADYFARLAAPRARIRNNVVSDFVAHAMSTSLLDMSYEDLVFFSWLGQTHGAPAVKRFLDVVSQGRDRQSYRVQAEAALSASDWKDFAIAFMSDNIRIPGTTEGIGADWSTLPRHRIGEGADVRLTADPLVVLGGVLVFGPPGQHQLHTVATPLPYGASPDASSASWPELPSSLDVQCHQEPTYFIAAMSAGARGQTIRISDNVEPADCEAHEGEEHSAANCILGSWQMTAADFARNIKDVLCPKSAQTCNATSGGLRLTFESTRAPYTQGTGLYVFEGVAFRGEFPAASNAGSFETSFNGTGHTRWAAVSNVLFLSYTDHSPIGTMHKVIHHRVHHYNTPDTETKDEPLYAPLGLGPFLGGRYRCDANSLHVDPPPGYPLDPVYSFDFTRIAGSPHH